MLNSYQGQINQSEIYINLESSLDLHLLNWISMSLTLYKFGALFFQEKMKKIVLLYHGLHHF